MTLAPPLNAQAPYPSADSPLLPELSALLLATGQQNPLAQIYIMQARRQRVQHGRRRAAVPALSLWLRITARYISSPGSPAGPSPRTPCPAVLLHARAAEPIHFRSSPGEWNDSSLKCSAIGLLLARLWRRMAGQDCARYESVACAAPLPAQSCLRPSRRFVNMVPDAAPLVRGCSSPSTLSTYSSGTKRAHDSVHN